MNHGRPSSTKADIPPASTAPLVGWHCVHHYYEFDRQVLANLDSGTIAEGCKLVTHVLDGTWEGRPERLQTSVVSGHKADFGIMMMDPDPISIDRVHQALLASDLGPALRPTYSFVSMSEISEYLPTVDDYRNRLVRDGLEGEILETKVKVYADRQPAMRQHRLSPEFPEWPATCFYPMNKKRESPVNWFVLPKSRRAAMMSEHGRSGMTYSGKVTQLVTTSVGLDDWEWGVTLWAKNPQYLKDIVYEMRFDEASAKYAEFGPFYTSYVMSAAEMLKHCFVGITPDIQ